MAQQEADNSVPPGRDGAGQGGSQATGAAALLADHCARFGGQGAALLALDGDGKVTVAAVHPPPRGDAAPPDWLGEALRSAAAAAGGDGATVRDLPDPDGLYGQAAARKLVLLPVAAAPSALGAARPARAVMAMAVAASGADALAAAWAQLRVETSAAELYALHARLPSRRVAPGQLGEALAVLAAVNEHERFLPAAMALCNELASRRGCDRVNVGFVRGPYVRLRAMSHTERFARQTRLVQAIEAAMEECQDQDSEVRFPAARGDEAVCRQAGELARCGGWAVLSLPLRRGGEVIGAVTAERGGELPFGDGEAEMLRLTCDLCSPRLAELERRDRWAGARASAALRGLLAVAVGPRHTWAKFAALAVLGGILAAALVRTDDRIDAAFVIQAARQRVVPAPFDGTVEQVSAEVDDQVAAGAVLARLKTLPLERELNARRLEAFEADKQADSARAAKSWSDAQQAAAKARKAREQAALLEERIAQTAVRAPIAGTVVVSRLEGMAGAPVSQGQVLFEVAPLGELRAELSVPEQRVAELLAAMGRGEVRGELAAASYPEQRLGFVVERIHPLGEETPGGTVFKVRARLLEGRTWLRPGMDGAAHVPLARRSYASIWLRRLDKWLHWRTW